MATIRQIIEVVFLQNVERMIREVEWLLVRRRQVPRVREGALRLYFVEHDGEEDNPFESKIVANST